MKLLDHFYKPGTYDCHTFVFDEKQGEFNTMLALSEDGYAFSQWTTGLYDPDGENDHLGTRVPISELGTTVLNAFFGRLSIPRGTEDFYATLDEIAEETAEYEDDGTVEPSLLDRLDELRRTLKQDQERHLGE